MTVVTFANYQELVDKATILEGKHQQMENRKRKYGHGKYNSGVQQKPRYSPYSGSSDQELASLEGIIITMEATFSMEEMDTTTMVTSMEVAMEGMATSSISTLLHQ